MKRWAVVILFSSLSWFFVIHSAVFSFVVSCKCQCRCTNIVYQHSVIVVVLLLRNCTRTGSLTIIGQSFMFLKICRQCNHQLIISVSCYQDFKLATIQSLLHLRQVSMQMALFALIADAEKPHVSLVSYHHH